MKTEGSGEQSRDEESGLGELGNLRRILVGPLREDLDELTEVVEAGIQPRALSDVLPEAVVLRQRKDERLADALAPTMERAVERSVRRNPQGLADALFPVMGPAIRKSIQHTLASMLEGLNRTMEYGLSVKGLKWRMEAWRTGRSFAEVVLLKSLVYRVEQALLIHRETGLLLEHAEHAGVGVTDPEMVSAMLTAIQQFVGDSFAKGTGPAVEQVEFGEGVLEIATGPHAALAVLLRGTPPAGLRNKLEETLEKIHGEHWQELAEFDGDPAPFFPTRELLEDCLGEQRVTKEEKPARRFTPAHFVLSFLAAVLLAWAWYGWRDRMRWNDAVQRLRDEPGLVVVDADRRWGPDRIGLLRDPHARDPEALLSEAGIDLDVVDIEQWSYRSLESDLVVSRARSALAPPSHVRLRLEAGGRLVVEGDVSDDWLRTARSMVPGIEGVETVERAQVEEAFDR